MFCGSDTKTGSLVIYLISALGSSDWNLERPPGRGQEAGSWKNGGGEYLSHWLLLVVRGRDRRSAFLLSQVSLFEWLDFRGSPIFSRTQHFSDTPRIMPSHSWPLQKHLFRISPNLSFLCVSPRSGFGGCGEWLRWGPSSHFPSRSQRCDLLNDI